MIGGIKTRKRSTLRIQTANSLVSVCLVIGEELRNDNPPRHAVPVGHQLFFRAAGQLLSSTCLRP